MLVPAVCHCVYNYALCACSQKRTSIVIASLFRGFDGSFSFSFSTPLFPELVGRAPLAADSSVGSEAPPLSTVLSASCAAAVRLSSAAAAAAVAAAASLLRDAASLFRGGIAARGESPGRSDCRLILSLRRHAFYVYFRVVLS